MNEVQVLCFMYSMTHVVTSSFCPLRLHWSAASWGAHGEDFAGRRASDRGDGVYDALKGEEDDLIKAVIRATESRNVAGICSSVGGIAV